MALVVPNVGELELIDWMINVSSVPENLTLKLFANDYTPVATSVDTDFTEASFTGYTSKTLTRGSWGTASTNGSGEAEIEYGSAQTWNATSSETIYGYFVVGATSGTLIYAERFDTSRPLSNGDSLTITPKITLKSNN